MLRDETEKNANRLHRVTSVGHLALFFKVLVSESTLEGLKAP